MPQPAAVVAASQQYLVMLQQAEARILASMDAIVDKARQFRKLGRQTELLAAVRVELDRIVDGTQAWLASTVPTVYQLGAVGTGLINTHIWTLPHRAAAQAIIDFQYTSVLSATKFMENDAKRWFREVSRLQNERSALEGLTRQQQAREIRRLAKGAIGANGKALRLDAVIYRNGARHGIVEYSNMLARTTTAVTFNTGATNTMATLGIKHVEAFDGPDCGAVNHDDGDKVHGTIRTLTWAQNHPISHPNCVRSFGARPDATALDDPFSAQSLISPETQANIAARQAARQAARTAVRRGGGSAGRAARTSPPPRPRRPPRTPRTSAPTPPPPPAAPQGPAPFQPTMFDAAGKPLKPGVALDAELESLVAQLDEVPLDLRQALHDAGVTIRFTENLTVNVFPELSGTQRAIGTFSPKSNVISVSTGGRNQILSTVHHEIGHALDHNFGVKTTSFSRTNPKWKDIHARANSQPNAHPYYAQGGATGQSEFFAESFAFHSRRQQVVKLKKFGVKERQITSVDLVGALGDSSIVDDAMAFIDDVLAGQGLAPVPPIPG